MNGSDIIPTIRYEDAPRMIEWLCAVFGFGWHLAGDDGAGGIAHAQLTLGDAMIMLGSARDDAFGALQTTARSLGGISQSLYVIVDDADAVCEKARPQLPRSQWSPKTKTMAGASSAAEIQKGSCGTLAPMIPGKPPNERILLIAGGCFGQNGSWPARSRNGPSTANVG